jgi:hypothetical protein
LRHHSEGVWEIAEDREKSSRWGDYLLRCVARSGISGGEIGKELVTYGEYMHRHGWTPVAVDFEETRP